MWQLRSFGSRMGSQWTAYGLTWKWRTTVWAFARGKWSKHRRETHSFVQWWRQCSCVGDVKQIQNCKFKLEFCYSSIQTLSVLPQVCGFSSSASIQITVAETLILDFMLWLYLNGLLYLYVICAHQSVVIQRLFQMALSLLVLLSHNLPNLFLLSDFVHKRVSSSRIALQLVQLLTVNAFVEHKLVLNGWNQLKLPALFL